MDIQLLNPSVELSAAPLPQGWVLEGCPTPRNAVLARSADRTSMTLLWDCTAGRFRWIYDEDETIHVLEGAATLTLADGREIRLKPGSMVFFPAGTVAEWQVHGYVRKLAVFRKALPAPLGVFVRLLAKLRPRSAATPLKRHAARGFEAALQPA